MKKKKILAAVLAALLLAGAGLFSGVLIRRAAGTKAALVPVYSVEGLCLKGWTGSVSVPVTVASGSSSIYYASSERPVSELYVEAGQSVEAGQPLFQYDTSGLLRELEGTEITLENQRTYLGRLGAYIEELKGELPSAGQGGASPSAGKDGLLSMKAAGSVPVAGGLIYIVEENAPEGESGSQPNDPHAALDCLSRMNRRRTKQAPGRMICPERSSLRLKNRSMRKASPGTATVRRRIPIFMI